MCCCRKSKKAYEISKGDEFKAEFEMEDEEAEALPEKLAFDDKEVLIAWFGHLAVVISLDSNV